MSLNSSAFPWRHCAGSVREEKAYPRSDKTESQLDGIGSHLLLEPCMNASMNAVNFIGVDFKKDGLTWVIDAERAKRVQVCLDYIATRKKALSVEFPDCQIAVESEQFLDCGAFFERTNWKGKCDVSIIVLNDLNELVFVEVIDYKDGGGYVDVNNNPQLLDYCFVKVANTESNIKCQITIVQPKIENNPIRTQLLTRHDAVKHAEKMQLMALATEVPDAPLNYDGDGKGWCHYCKHLPNCEAARISKIKTLNESEYLISEIHSDLTQVDNAKLSQILKAEKVYMDAFTRAKIEAESRIERGETVPEYYMSAGKESYKWLIPNEEVEKKLRSQKKKLGEVYVQKLITPAQARKLEMSDVQRKNLEKIIETVEGKPTLKRGEPQETAMETFGEK